MMVRSGGMKGLCEIGGKGEKGRERKRKEEKGRERKRREEKEEKGRERKKRRSLIVLN
jgi:hypothetical protein